MLINSFLYLLPAKIIDSAGYLRKKRKQNCVTSGYSVLWFINSHFGGIYKWFVEERTGEFGLEKGITLIPSLFLYLFIQVLWKSRSLVHLMCSERNILCPFLGFFRIYYSPCVEIKAGWDEVETELYLQNFITYIEFQRYL